MLKQTLETDMPKKPILCLVLLMGSTAVWAGDLPDPSLTPGALDPEVMQSNIQESICKAGHFTWTEGHMPPKSFLEKTEKEQITAYGYPDENTKHYQMDHLIPLSLGGNPTDAKNIWPQLLISKWSARRKDYLEGILHEKVCKGELSLSQAQEEIRSNWIGAYEKYLGPADRHP